jgi:peptidyl-prolyl cis-trans isomerase SurA
MDHAAARRLALACAVLLSAYAAAGLVASSPFAAQAKPRQTAVQAPPAGAEKQGQPAKSEQSIVVLVNDDPVTGYEIQQRAKFIALNANVTEQVKENFKRMVQAESTSRQVRAILDEVIRANPGKSREQIGAIFEQRKTQFAQALQKQALDSVRAGLVPKYKQEAQEELIEERLKLQEAKRAGIDITDDDVKRMMKTLAERNKMTEEQFAQHIKGLGVDISTMQERTRAQVAWREVVRRKFSAQISITNRDIDKMCRRLRCQCPPRWIRWRWPSAMPRRMACASGSTAARPWRAWPRRPATPGSRT